jgi:hypothetical protein
MNQRTGFISTTGEFQTGRFARFIMIRPWTWAAALRLARNSKRAARALSAWLAETHRELLNRQGDGLSESKIQEREKAQEREAKQAL